MMLDQFTKSKLLIQEKLPLNQYDWKYYPPKWYNPLSWFYQGGTFYLGWPSIWHIYGLCFPQNEDKTIKFAINWSLLRSAKVSYDREFNETQIRFRKKVDSFEFKILFG